jgi:hypothetical protein
LHLLFVVAFALLHAGWNSIAVAQQLVPQVVPDSVARRESVGQGDQYIIKTHLVRLNRSQAAHAHCFSVLDDAKVDRTKLSPLSPDVESQLRDLQKARVAMSDDLVVISIERVR